jgi:hypothetical protein
MTSPSSQTFHCQNCGTFTDKPDWTEEKDVDLDGVMTRHWLPLCSHCGRQVKVLHSLTNVLFDIARRPQ